MEACGSALDKKFDVQTVIELLSLPVLRHEHGLRCSLMLAAFEDGAIHDAFVREFCDCITSDPADCRIDETPEKLEQILKNKAPVFTTEQLLQMGNAFETLYAVGYETLTDIILTIYKAIHIPTIEFNPYSFENTRAMMARMAYCCKEYNYPIVIEDILAFYKDIKATGVKGLKGMAFYYIGLCQRFSQGKDPMWYMEISNNKNFHLAEIYLDHPKRNIYIETSKTDANHTVS